MGQVECTERSRDKWQCSVVVCLCKEEGTTRQKARRKKNRTKPHNASGGRAAQSERAAGERDGEKGQTRDREKRNHSTEEQN